MNSSVPVVNHFKAYFKALHEADFSQLGAIYDKEILFKDPVHEIHGLSRMEDYLSSLCAELQQCRFEYLSELVSDNAAYIKWLMHFQHPRLGNRLISLRGVTHLLIGEKIEYHEDFYDMGAMLYEQVPVLGTVTRWLKNRLAGAQ